MCASSLALADHRAGDGGFFLPEEPVFAVGALVRLAAHGAGDFAYVGRGCFSLARPGAPLYEGTPFGDFDQDENAARVAEACQHPARLHYVTRAHVSLFDGAESDARSCCAVALSRLEGSLDERTSFVVLLRMLRVPFSE